MESPDPPLAMEAALAAPRAKRSNLPEPFASRMAGRERRPLGELFGLKNFGVNLTSIAPGGETALLHRHGLQDEFVFVLQGEPTLVTERGEVALHPGMCAGFAAGGVAHQLVNRSESVVVYLEIGDRTPGDWAEYPNDDLAGKFIESGQWTFCHKDGRPY